MRISSAVTRGNSRQRHNCTVATGYTIAGGTCSDSSSGCVLVNVRARASERTKERTSLGYNDRWRFRVRAGFIVDLNNTRSVENNAGLGKRRFNGPRITILIAGIRYSAERMDFKSIRAAFSRQLIDSSFSGTVRQRQTSFPTSRFRYWRSYRRTFFNFFSSTTDRFGFSRVRSTIVIIFT